MTNDVLAFYNMQIEYCYQFLVTKLREYIQSINFSKVVLGLSGGIDSALVAKIAVDAIGPNNVHCIGMPSQFSSKESLVDAAALSNTLGCKFDVIKITSIKEAIENALHNVCGNLGIEITTENIQARIRGLILMAVSNKLGELVLATGNKSEILTGYATLYGDTCGAIAPIGDLYKTQIYQIAHWINNTSVRDKGYVIIPASIIQKEPSAELRPNHKDSNDLPPYNTLDKILYFLIEKNMNKSALAELLKCEISLIECINDMWIKSEFKRKQSPPKIKIGPS